MQNEYFLLAGVSQQPILTCYQNTFIHSFLKHVVMNPNTNEHVKRNDNIDLSKMYVKHSVAWSMNSWRKMIVITLMTHLKGLVLPIRIFKDHCPYFALWSAQLQRRIVYFAVRSLAVVNKNFQRMITVTQKPWGIDIFPLLKIWIRHWKLVFWIFSAVKKVLVLGTEL